MKEFGLDYDDEEQIRDLLIGKSVKKVNKDTLILNDGTELKIIPNEGCGGCSNGWYEITELNGCENIITNVTFECIDNSDDDMIYRIFVFAKDKNIKLLEVSGGDGNGYYGTGYSIDVIIK